MTVSIRLSPVQLSFCRHVIHHQFSAFCCRTYLVIKKRNRCEGLADSRVEKSPLECIKSLHTGYQLELIQTSYKTNWYYNVNAQKRKEITNNIQKNSPEYVYDVWLQLSGVTASYVVEFSPSVLSLQLSSVHHSEHQTWHWPRMFQLCLVTGNYYGSGNVSGWNITETGLGLGYKS